MIPKHIREGFINKAVQNYDWVKNMTQKELYEGLDELAPGFRFKREPFDHQLACFLIGVTNPNFFYMMDMGTGKSSITLSLLQYYKNIGKLGKTLIVAPKSQHLYTWAEEVFKDSNLTICVLDDTTKGRAELLDSSNADIFVVNYPGLMYLATSWGEVYNKKTKKWKGQQLLDSEKLKWLSSKFQAIVCDESQWLKNHDSLNYKICKQISLHTPYRYLLSGTPINRNPEDFWSQFNILDRGDTLGTTLGIYRECFFKTKKNHWGGFEHKFIHKMEPQLHRLLKNRSIWYSAEECQTLPEQVFNKVYVDFNEETESYYDRLIQEIRANNKDYVAVKSAFIKMRMLTSGFLGFVNETSEEKINITFKSNPKLDALMDIIAGFPKDAKFIIFNEFIHSGNIISEALKKKGIGHERLWSGTKDAQAVLENFKNNPKCLGLLCNNQSGSEGLNLQNASRIIYFELPTSNITRQQGLKRIHRAGQTNTCFYWDVLVKGSVDERIYESLETGKDIFTSLVTGNNVL